jgi:hypothetical protein
MSNLWAQHNEHRILLPRVIFVLDKAFFSGRNIFNLFVILATQAAHAILIFVLARRLGLSGRLPAALALAVLFSVMFSAYQWENLVWGFQVQFVGVYAFASAAFVTISGDGGKLRRLILASTFSTLAVLTMANGILVSYVLVLIALLLRLPECALVSLAALALGLTMAYLHGYETPPWHSDPLDSWHALPDILVYALTYIGGAPAALIAQGFQLACTTCGFDVTKLALLLGGLAVAAVVGATVHLFSADSRPGAEAGIFGICVFIVATAFLTAAGRHSLGPSQALASRYGTPVLVFWTCLSLLLFGRGLFRLCTIAPIPCNVLILGPLLIIAVGQVNGLKEAHALSLLSRQVEAALLSGVSDMELFRRVNPHPENMSRKITMLLQHRSSVFATRESKWVTAELRSLFPLSHPGDCIGGLDEIAELSSSSARLRGWAWSHVDRSPPKWILAVDNVGVVRGVGVVGHFRPDVRRALGNLPTSSENSGWVLYLTIPWEPGASALFALVGDPQRACPLTQ